MAHDVLGMRLNRVTVPVEPTGGDSSAPPKPKSYDVDESDSFWSTHAGNPFPEVAESVHNSIEEFNAKRGEMSKTDDNVDAMGGGLSDGLAAAINALPEMTEKKRSIDMHTNIAMALMSEIKARELDKYYEIEDQFASQSAASSIKGMEELMSDTQKGTMIDKLRALMCLYLSKPTIEEAKLQGLIDALAAAGAGSDVDGMAHHGMAYLRHLASIRNMSMPSVVRDASPNQQNSASGSLMGAMARLATGAQAASEGMLAVGMKGLKNIVASEAETPVCQIMDGLMEQKPGLTEKYLYLDPKAAPVPPGGEAPRIRAPFRRGIAFVIGGGNYPEMQSLQEWGQKHGRQVSYGSTDMVAPKQFVEELCELGKSLSSDMR